MILKNVTKYNIDSLGITVREKVAERERLEPVELHTGEISQSQHVFLFMLQSHLNVNS